MIAGATGGDDFTESTEFQLRDGGVLYDLNNLLDSSGVGWLLIEAAAINNSGQIVGYGMNLNEELLAYKGFLLTPVPEPETYAKLGLGLGLMGWVGRRRNVA